MQTTESERLWLERRGVDDRVLRTGLEGLVHDWELTARELAEGWDLDLDDYIKDLAPRQILWEMERDGMLAETALKRIHLADHLFQASTKVVDSCVCTDCESATWNSEDNWWYWRKPH